MFKTIKIIGNPHVARGTLYYACNWDGDYTLSEIPIISHLCTQVDIV